MLSIQRNAILVMIVALSGAALLSKAYQTKPDFGNSPPAAPAGNSTDTSKAYNEALLIQLERVCRELDGNDRQIAFSGTLYMHDKSDTTVRPETLPFRLCRNGKELYYKLGATELFNSAEYYVFTDHDTKKVVVSDPKQVVAGSIIDIRKVREALLSEEYELKRSIRGAYTTISLVNENHITCKEYAVTFETATHSVRRFFLRFSNINDPVRRDNEKIVDLQITGKEKDPDIARLLQLIPVSKDNTGWKLKAAYMPYELIKL